MQIEVEMGRDVYIVYTNTDLTEGRGFCYPKHVAQTQATALRLASRAYVQGSDAPVVAGKAYMIKGEWYAPVRLVIPTGEDVAVQKRIDDRREAIAKLLAAGLSMKDIEALSYK